MVSFALGTSTLSDNRRYNYHYTPLSSSTASPTTATSEDNEMADLEDIMTAPSHDDQRQQRRQSSLATTQSPDSVAKEPDDLLLAATAQEPLSEEEDRRILRAIDLNLLPIMAVSYLFQFLDKSALSYTAIMSLREDLNLTGLEYSWAAAIYYVGYLVASYPAGWIMIRSRVGKTVAASILIWGMILMLTAVCSNAAGLLTNRFFLGVAESAVAPGLAIIVSMWYKRKEQPIRQGAWFLGNVLAGIVGGLTAYGIGHIESIPAWKAVFLIFGAMTVAWSSLIFFLLPDTPMTARFLSKADRAKAVRRVEENMTGIKNDEWKRYQFLEAMIDPQVWLFFLIQLCSQIANGGVHGFGSIIVKGFGFSTLNTLLLQMIANVFQGVFVVISMVGATYIPKSRSLFMAWHLVIAMVGAAMIRQIDHDNKWARFMGYCLTIAYSANFPMLLAMSSSNIGGFTKKTTTNAMIFIAYCAGNIIGPQLFFENEAPVYQSGFLSMMICFGVGIACCFALRMYLSWENRRRDRMGRVLEVDALGPAVVSVNLADMTDKEIPQFRYLY